MGKTILVTDDELELISLMKMRLTQRGYEVIGAQSGEECIEKARMQQPDLILLDIVMPLMDGYEVLLKLKASEETHHIPVIMLTAQSSDIDKMDAKYLGAVEYIMKPIDSKTCMEKIRNVIG